MEAKLVAELPEEAGWQFEPKWDGFRALVFRDGADVEILSKSGNSLARYFPEIVALVTAVDQARFILDGELLLPIDDVLSFDALQARLHPAESRVARLSLETPAQLMLFDCLQDGERDLLERPLVERRAALEAFHTRHGTPSLLLSPCGDLETARSWLAQSGGALDGVIAKRSDDPYRPGQRAMLKVKQHRTADCVRRRSRDGGTGPVESPAGACVWGEGHSRCLLRLQRSARGKALQLPVVEILQMNMNRKQFLRLSAGAMMASATFGSGRTEGARRDVQMVRDAGMDFIRGSDYPHSPALVAGAASAPDGGIPRTWSSRSR